MVTDAVWAESLFRSRLFFLWNDGCDFRLEQNWKVKVIYVRKYWPSFGDFADYGFL